jgi:acylphosphatase
MVVIDKPNTNTMILHYDIIVSGRVQHVGFRFYAQRNAHELEITGLIRNKRDGSVLIEAEGEEEKLRRFVEWCHEGPPWAHVESVSFTEGPVKELKGFLVK